MQFAVRSSSYRIFVVFIALSVFQAAQGQDSVPPADPPARQPATESGQTRVAVQPPALSEESTQNPSVGEPAPPVTAAPSAAVPLRPSLLPAASPASPASEPVGSPAPPVHQAATIDQVEDRSSADSAAPGVHRIATSVVEGPIEKASFNQPPTQNNSLTGTSGLNLELPRQMMAQFEVSPADRELPGRPVTLLEMLRETRVAYRNDMIHQYWTTYADWALLQNAQEYQAWLQQVSRPATGPERILLSAARHEAESQVLAAEIALSVSQQRLQELSGTKDSLLPLPRDTPLIKGYQTHYEWFSSRNLVPAPLKGIHQRLPRQLRLISQRAETVRIAKSAMNQTRTAFTGGQQHVASVLEAGRLWQTGSRQLIETVTEYNQAIADYAIAIHREFKSPEQVVSMLIPNPGLTESQNGAQNGAQTVRNQDLPIARTADRSFASPLARSPAVQNPGMARTPATGSTASSAMTVPLRTAQGSPLAPVPAPPASASTSVLEPALPNSRPNLVPLSQTNPPAKQTDNGFRPLPATQPTTTPSGQPPTKPSNNGFQAPPVNRSDSNPPTNNNSFGGGSFGGS